MKESLEPMSGSDGTPFKKPLTPHEHDAKSLWHNADRRLHMVGGDDTLVIRSDLGAQTFYEKSFVPGTSKEQMVRSVKKEFDALRDHGISVPADFIMAKNESGQPGIWSIVRNVQGEDLGSLVGWGYVSEETLVERIGEAHIDFFWNSYEDYFIQVLEYYMDAFDSSDIYLTDLIKPDQIVWGTLSEEEAPRLHLIDTDPLVGKVEGGGGLLLSIEILAERAISTAQQHSRDFSEFYYILRETIQRLERMRIAPELQLSTLSRLEKMLAAVGALDD